MEMLKKVIVIGVVAATTTLGTAGIAYADTGAHFGVMSAYSGDNDSNQGPTAGHNESNNSDTGHSESNNSDTGHSESNNSAH
jgi:hypothetical protein